jgi:hypothetical protein
VAEHARRHRLAQDDGVGLDGEVEGIARPDAERTTQFGGYDDAPELVDVSCDAGDVHRNISRDPR